MVPTLNVLIIDDSEADADLMLRELRRGGFAPASERVQDAAGLQKALQSRLWDLVISDFAMPGFTGLDALRLVQEAMLDLPFIIVSGTIGEDVAVDTMLAGAQDFMVKGRLARLGPAIHRELKEAAVRRERLQERARAEAERDRLIAELREAVAARDSFLALASHELKTPLTSMLLQIQSIQRGREAALESEFASMVNRRIDTIARQALRLGSLTKNLLDVARITSGRIALVRETIDLGALVHEVVEQSRELGAPGPPVNVDVTVSVGQWDRVRLETVIANLVSNAEKFGEGRAIDVVVEDTPDVARVRVTDRGIGITPEQQARIFEKFERAVPAEHYGGLGLGLWISREIVEAHGGTIRVASASGKGSIFMVELPKNAPTG